MRKVFHDCFVLLAATSIGLAFGCTGQVGDPGESLSEPPIGPPVFPPGTVNPGEQAASTAIPRLSRREIEAAIVATFAISDAATSALPADADGTISPTTGGFEEIFDTFTGTLGEYIPGEVFVQSVATRLYGSGHAP